MEQSKKPRFAVCIQNTDSEDLEPRKIYQLLLDDKAESEGYLRVIDESGEDYLYPVGYFFVLPDLPEAVEQALLVNT